MVEQVDYANPSVWGPHFWFMMESIANTYPDEPTRDEKKHTYNFFHELRYVLPCKTCRVHYSETLKLFSIRGYLHNRHLLISWVDKIHKYINDNKSKNAHKELDKKKSKKDTHIKKLKDKKSKDKDVDNINYKNMIMARKSGGKSFRRTFKCKACGRG